MRPLYEISWELEQILELEDSTIVDTSTGEVLTEEKLNSLKMEFQEKIEQVCLYIKSKEAEKKALKEEAEKLKARADACDHKIEWLTSYVQNHLKGEKFSTARCVVKYTTGKSAIPSPEWQELTPECYWKPQDPTVDKAQIRKDLLAGKVVPGWELLVKTNLKVA